MLKTIIFLAAAILIGAFTVACGDDDDDNSSSGQGGSDSEKGTQLELTARNSTFNTLLLPTVPQKQVTLTFKNEDDGVRHNFALYRVPQGGDPLFEGEPVVGKATVTYTFTTPIAGNYFFRCQFHPQAMNGDFQVFAQ